MHRCFVFVLRDELDRFFCVSLGQRVLIDGKLNDFRHHFRQIYDFTKLLNNEMAELRREIARVQAATKKIDEQSCKTNLLEYQNFP